MVMASCAENWDETQSLAFLWMSVHTLNMLSHLLEVIGELLHGWLLCIVGQIFCHKFHISNFDYPIVSYLRLRLHLLLLHSRLWYHRFLLWLWHEDRILRMGLKMWGKGLGDFMAWCKDISVVSRITGCYDDSFLSFH